LQHKICPNRDLSPQGYGSAPEAPTPPEASPPDPPSRQTSPAGAVPAPPVAAGPDPRHARPTGPSSPGTGSGLPGRAGDLAPTPPECPWPSGFSPDFRAPA